MNTYTKRMTGAEREYRPPGFLCPDCGLIWTEHEEPNR
jgi:hypothetical protein